MVFGDDGFTGCPAPILPSVLRPWLVGRSGWAFPGLRGAISKEVVRVRLAKAGVKAGIVGRVTPHRLRHTFATDAADAGWNQLALQSQLGHNDPQSTLWYYRPSRKGLIRAYRKAREAPDYA